MLFCFTLRLQHKAEEANLPEGDAGVANVCHTRCCVQQRAYGTMPGVFFQTINMEMQRLRRRRTQHKHQAGDNQPGRDPTCDIALFVFHSSKKTDSIFLKR